VKAHPAAELFPMMDQGRLRELADDIKAHGLRDDIVTFEGKILDGRNRYRACEIAGVEPRFAEWADDGNGPTAYVLSENLHRRDLTPSQRAAIAVEALPQFEEESRQRMLAGQRDPGERIPQGRRAPKSTQKAAALTGTNERYVREAKEIKKADPELFEQVRKGEIGVKAASRKVGRSFGEKWKPTNSAKQPRRGKGLDQLRGALDPMSRYLRDWDPEHLQGVTPAQAARLLPVVQRIDRGLFEIERLLEDRSVKSRALS
jgi:ParB-like chromosome segregation protein Spo0J